VIVRVSTICDRFGRRDGGERPKNLAPAEALVGEPHAARQRDDETRHHDGLHYKQRPDGESDDLAANPAICSASPRIHAGRRNSWRRKRELSGGARPRRTALLQCVACAKAQAATRARRVAIPVADPGPRGADYAGAAG